MITTRNLVLAAATLLALGTTALSSTEASAYGFRHGFYHHYHYSHFGYRHWSYRYHWHYRHFAWRSHYRYRYSYGGPTRTHYWRPAIGGAPMSSGSPAPGPAIAAAPAPSRPACLTKAYTPEGAVVFNDRCTQESAMTPPPGADAPPGGPLPRQQ
ncbi:MAG: hypothetical protein ACXWJ8_09010 [Xanthobacteraceae bacterium]